MCFLYFLNVFKYNKLIKYGPYRTHRSLTISLQCLTDISLLYVFNKFGVWFSYLFKSGNICDTEDNLS